jgi:hypothetical protein
MLGWMVEKRQSTQARVAAATAALGWNCKARVPLAVAACQGAQGAKGTWQAVAARHTAARHTAAGKATLKQHKQHRMLRTHMQQEKRQQLMQCQHGSLNGAASCRTSHVTSDAHTPYATKQRPLLLTCKAVLPCCWQPCHSGSGQRRKP